MFENEICIIPVAIAIEVVHSAKQDLVSETHHLLVTFVSIILAISCRDMKMLSVKSYVESCFRRCRCPRCVVA